MKIPLLPDPSSVRREVVFPLPPPNFNHPPPPIPSTAGVLKPTQGLATGVEGPAELPSFFNNPASTYQHVESDKQRQAREWRVQRINANPQNRFTTTARPVERIFLPLPTHGTERVEPNAGVGNLAATGADQEIDEVLSDGITNGAIGKEPTKESHELDSLKSGLISLRKELDSERGLRLKAQSDLGDLAKKTISREAEWKLRNTSLKQKEELQASRASQAASLKLKETELDQIRLELDAVRAENGVLKAKIEADHRRDGADLDFKKAIDELKALHEGFNEQARALFDSVDTVRLNTAGEAGPIRLDQTTIIDVDEGGEGMDNEGTTAVDNDGGDPTDDGSYVLMIEEPTVKKKRGRPPKNMTQAGGGGVTRGGAILKRLRKK